MSEGAVLVTGGNSGIGLECARALARQGRPVLIASRDRYASSAAVADIARDTGNEAIEALQLDLGSFDSVRQLAKEIESRDLPLQAVVCNAGLQMSHGPVLSDDGYELTFAVNHLGHFLLVNLLLRRLLASAPARVVVVSSGVHDPALTTGMPKPDIDDLDVLAATGGRRSEGYDGQLAYVNSKLCNLWFAYELARRVEARGLASEERPLAILAWEPGLVPGSGLARDYPPLLQFLWNRVLPAVAAVASPFVPSISTLERSGGALARLVSDASLERTTGTYYPSHSRWREAPSSEASRDPERARALWEASVRMTGLDASDSPLIDPLVAPPHPAAPAVEGGSPTRPGTIPGDGLSSPE